MATDPEGYQTLDELAEEGNHLCPVPLFNEPFLAEDEAKTKIAVRILIPIDSHVHRTSSLLQFYNFSSRTTGKSKTVAISHYMVIVTVMTCATTYQIGNPDAPHRFQPGDVATNSGVSFSRVF